MAGPLRSGSIPSVYRRHCTVQYRYTSVQLRSAVARCACFRVFRLLAHRPFSV